MSRGTGHIFEECPKVTKELLRSKRSEKETMKRSSKGKPLFTCGGCLTKFKTVCWLHDHLEGHIEGGSYTYDHITKTAFPKYDSVCAYSQVETNDADLLENVHQGNTAKCRNTVKAVNNNIVDVIRRSRRIALKSNKSKGGVKVKELEGKVIEAEENIITFRPKNKKSLCINNTLKLDVAPCLSGSLKLDVAPCLSGSLKLDVTPCLSGSLKLDVAPCLSGSLKLDERHKDVENKNEKVLADKVHKEEQTDSSFNTILYKSIKPQEEVEENLTKTTNEETPKAKVIVVHLTQTESLEKKTDEITASEALIAISKSAASKHINQIAKKVEESGRTVNSIHESCVKSNDYLDASRSTEPREQTTDEDECHDGFGKPKSSMKGVVHSANDKSAQADIETDSEFDIKTDAELEDAGKDTDQKYESPTTTEKNEKVACPVCGKTGTRSMVSYHKYLHKEQKELSCDKCGKLFQHPSCLKVHLRSHEGKLYGCSQCPEKFSRKKYLEIHMLKHSGEKPFMCETCGKSYRNDMHLKRHIKHVHKQIRNFECDICKERFFRSDHMKCHRLRHFDSGLRCSFCKRKFKLPSDLSRHLVVHTGEKNWYCHLCGHGFRYPVPYYNHMKKKHDIERKEAIAWRKLMIEQNKTAKDQVNIDKKSDTKNIINHNGSEMVTSTDSAVEYSEVASFENFNDKESFTSGSIEATCNVSPVPVEPMFKVIVKHDTVSTDNRIEQTSSLYTTATSEGYRFFSLPNFTNNNSSSLKVLPELALETTSSLQNLVIPLHEGNFQTGSPGNCIVGYEDGSNLQNEQMIVMGEETVREEIGAMTGLDGENMQAVMFIDDNECAGEVIIDQDTTI